MRTFVFGDYEVEIVDADYVAPPERVLEFRYCKPVRYTLFASVTIPDDAGWEAARLRACLRSSWCGELA
ncbi:hypothetical protein, partial [Actinophytocola xanthii]|uniref:hypothetical protein n=1 Tax=Actinophytocola xanthii TaxID=1912961 RepID=UPI001E4E70F4